MLRAILVAALALALTGFAQAKDFKQLPPTNDWQTAVQITQRVFPGSQGWLLSCSASEGGHGSFKWNNQGSGAGGWLQFMRSTFESNVGQALGHAKRHGFKLPPGTRSYYSPLGQALTGAYMWHRGWTSHWYGSGC
jgi:opacity protein-like surface antigen